MAVTLKEETILNQWSMLVDGAAARGSEVLDDIQARLADLNAVIAQTYFRAAHPQSMTQSLFNLV